MPMRKTIVALLAAASLALTISSSTVAHQAPCDESLAGHSSYAQHHIVPLAQGGTLGGDGHVPGHHQGYPDLCRALAE